jgi:Acetyltransferases
MKIKNAELIDLLSILELQKLCYQENAERYNDYKIGPLVQTIYDLKEEFKNSIILKVEDDSKIIGSVRAFEKNKSCYIGRIIVHPDYQNKGIGKKLMVEIENRFPKCVRFELFTGFKDQKNIYFYQKLGYWIFKIEKVTDNLDLIYLEKVIS